MKQTDLTARDDWNRHWEQYSVTVEDNPAQKYRRELIFSMLGLHGAGEGARILDIGSGQGDMAATILSRLSAAQVLGIELSQSGVEISRKKVPRARFIQRDLLADEDPLDDVLEWATHAVCAEVIEHVDDPTRLLRNVRSYMAPGGLLVLTAPGGPMSAFDRHIGHRKHWKPKEIDEVLRSAGYSPVLCTGVGFPFFNLYRGLIILRGRKLIDDLSIESPKGLSRSARAAMVVFDRLIRPNLNSSKRGWQMVAIARS